MTENITYPHTQVVNMQLLKKVHYILLNVPFFLAAAAVIDNINDDDDYQESHHRNQNVNDDI